MGRELKKSIPIIREREGNEKNPFPQFGNGKGMKKSIPTIRERESEASIPGNGQEREFPLTPEPSIFGALQNNTNFGFKMVKSEAIQKCICHLKEKFHPYFGEKRSTSPEVRKIIPHNVV